MALSDNLIQNCIIPPTKIFKVYFMAKRCDITGKQAQVGNKVSHANNKTKRRFGVNIRKIKVVLEDGTTKRIKVAASTLRTMRKADRK